MAKILIKLNNETLQEFHIEKDSITIGRDTKSDIVLDDILVSRYHAKIVFQDQNYYVQDLKSGNGIYVNSTKVTKKTLQNWDEIAVGKYTLIFVSQKQVIFDEPEDSGEIVGEKTFVLPINRPEVMAVMARQEAPVEVSDAPLEGQIVMLTGDERDQPIELSNVCTVAGKSDAADIKLRGLFVGQNAFTISKRPDGFFIKHFEGWRVTKVNGSVVIGQRELQDGDLITVGPTMMRFSHRSEGADNAS
jgi:pSer/pThr/pTyr-binding forkhead associated (FHA) protein